MGTILVLGACAWGAWRLWRSEQDTPAFDDRARLARLSAFGGWSIYAYALLGAQVHENHLFLAIPLFIVAAALDRRFRSVLWWVTAIHVLNILLFEGLGRGLPLPIDRRWTGIDATVLLSVVNVAVFIWATGRLQTPSPSAPQSAWPSADASPADSTSRPLRR